MNRRSFLLGLLAAPVLALPKPIKSDGDGVFDCNFEEGIHEYVVSCAEPGHACVSVFGPFPSPTETFVSSWSAVPEIEQQKRDGVIKFFNERTGQFEFRPHKWTR